MLSSRYEDILTLSLSPSLSLHPLFLSILSHSTELPPQSGPGAHYENPHWGHQPANRSATSASASANHSGWDTVIIDESDTEAWPSISRSSQSQGPAGGCPSDTDPASSSSSMSMATGANGQTGHFPANYPSSKGASSGPGSSANHPGAGTVSMASSQGAANRGWGSGPGPSPHGPPQSSSVGGGEGKSDGPMGGGGGRGWGSSSSTTSNLNLNPNANPSAWPVLGHDGGGGAGASSSGGANPNQPPSSQPPPNLCDPPGTSHAQGNGIRGGNMVGGTNGNLPVGGGSTWGESSEPHPSSSTNVSFSSEPQNLNTDGPNHTSKQQEPHIHSVSGWSGPSGGMSSLGQPPPGASQLVNGEDGSSIWGNNGDAKSVASSTEPSGWDSGAGGWGSHGSSGGGPSGGWGGQSSRDAWGKQHSGEVQGGWDAPSSPPQQARSWSTRAPSTMAASEGSSEGMDGAGHSLRQDRSSRDEPAPLLPAPDLDPRVLCNTGWGQTPVRQHTSWDMEEAARTQRKADAAGTDSWGGSGPNTPTEPAQGPSNPSHGPPHRVDPKSEGPGPGPQAAPGSRARVCFGSVVLCTVIQSTCALIKVILFLGWGEPSSAHPKPEPSWGEPAPPLVSVDNGTSAWGKPTGSHGGWGVGDNSPEPYRRGNAPLGSAPCKPAPKSMQDGWGGGGGGEDMGLSGGPWDPDDGDMWSSQASQESNSWGNRPRKAPPKGKIPGKQEEAWIMNRLIKQLTDMGFPRDPAEEALKRNNMNLDQAMSALLEKKTELDRRGMGMSDYNNCLINKGPMGCRPPLHSKESSSDRSPFLDKSVMVTLSLWLSVWAQDGVGSLVEDVHTSSPFMPCSPGPLGLKLPSLPLSSQGLGGPQGLAMQNLNNRQVGSTFGMLGCSSAAQARAMQQPPPQPPVPPLGSSQPSLRAQVPQFLSPQVQAQLLQFAAKNIGLNPALLTSPINPQHMTLLNQLYQLQLAYQRLQIQQQMLQAQRNVSGPIRQQEQHVARTINNMQQQIQQHQRQLAQALLIKQQQTLGSLSSSGLHHGQGKSALDLFPGHPQAPGLPDLQTKEQQSSPNSYSPYPLSGLNPNMNVTCIEVGGLSMKELPQPQSRLSQWTHPNSMDSLSGGSSSLEPNLNKHGTNCSNLGPPGKPPQMEDGYSPYGMMPVSESPTNPLVPPDSWSQGKSPNDKMVNGANITWPPEFCPGVPWKGLQNIDPENDPNMTPGSVPSGPTINTNIQDVNRYLQRDRSGGKLSDMKSTWSPGPISHPSQVSLSHELWKVPQGPRSNTAAPTRPPPGLTNPTKHSSTWGGNSLGLAQGWSSSYSSAATTWSTDSSNRTSSWLVLRNLTPQIDGSTLRTLCMQHGPLITFHLNLTQGNALVRYSSKEEAAKAQKSLHMCVLGNTTILAEFAGEEEVQRFFAQGQQLASTTSWQADPGVNQTRMGGSGPRSSHPIGHPHWNSGGSGGGMGGGGAKTAGDLLWGGVPQYSSLWGPPSGEEGRVMGSPTPINTLLPGDLLSGESM
uniref:Trinucleotide repeat-containing gene 6C protein n=1 Tax=Oncorhynchus kisutch TaxID=8019 RepID=A0A8C7CNM9_ONCKI